MLTPRLWTRLCFPPSAWLICAGSLPIPAEAEGPTAQEQEQVRGVVRVEGRAPEPRQWQLDKPMQQLMGQEIYRDERWLVGARGGLANCVVVLQPKRADLPSVPPLPKPVVFRREGVRFVPRVLVVTSKSKLILSNPASPCRGFFFAAEKHPNNRFNILIPEGEQREVQLQGPDVCRVTCRARSYAAGFVHVVDTPYYALTNERGEFEILNVPRGDYDISVWHEEAGDLPAAAGPKSITLGGFAREPLEYVVTP